MRTPRWPASWNARIRWSGIPFPSVTSGAVTSMPSFTRSGRPNLSFASRPPSGSTLAAFRVSSSTMAGLDYRRPDAPPAKSAPPEAAANPQAQTPRPPSRPRGAGSVVVHLRPALGDRREDPRAAVVRAARHAGQHIRLRLGRAHDPGDPPRLSGADRRAVERDLAVDEACDRRDRGQAVLRAPRRRPARDGACGLGGRHAPRCGPGGLDDHPAVRQERLPDEPEVDRPQARRGCARVAAGAEMDEGPDPERVPQYRVLREPGVRRRAGVADLLPPQRCEARARGGGAPRRDTRGSEPVRPGRASGARAGSSYRRADADVPAAVLDGISVPGRTPLPDARSAQRLFALGRERCGAVLRELRARPARRPVRSTTRIQRRLAREDDD